MATKKWNFLTSVFILNSLFLHKEKSGEGEVWHLDIKSPFVIELTKNMNQIFSPQTFNETAVLGQFSKFVLYKFIKLNTQGGNLSNFYKNPKVIIFKENKVERLLFLLEKLIEKEKVSEEVSEMILKYNPEMSLASNIEYLKINNSLTEIEIHNILLKQQDICWINNCFVPKESVKNNIGIGSCQQLDSLRRSISAAFDHNSNYNLLPFNDPTGTGKTHAVINNFIQKFPNEILMKKETEKYVIVSERKNLIFIAPLKNQLTFSNSLYEVASKNAIPWLYLRSQEDLTNLELDSFFKKESGEPHSLTANKFWNYLFSILAPSMSVIDRKLNSFKLLEKKKRDEESENNQELDDLSVPKVSRLKTLFLNLSNFETNNFDLKDISEESYNDELKKTKDLFQREMKKIAMLLSKSIGEDELEQIFLSNAMYKGHKELDRFGKNKSLYTLTYFLLCFAFPLEVAKYINCVIFTTGAKSQTKIPFMVSQKRDKNKKTFIGLDLEEVISGFKLSSEVDILKYNDDKDFGECIKNELFKEIDGHYFTGKKIGFSIVLDEEHILHNIFTNQNTYKTITETYFNSKVNIVHAFSGINRWRKNALQENSLINNFESVIKEKNTIVEKLYTALKKHTVLNTDEEIDDFLEGMSSNNYGFFVKIEDFDFISSVCKNVLSFSPSQIMLKSFLQKISMVMKKNSATLLFTKNKQKYEPESVRYSVFDFFQITLCLLYILRETSSSLRRELPQEQLLNGQNIAISHLCNIAFNNRYFLENLYQSSLNLNDNSPLNIQFTYFLTKIGFNFEFPNKIKREEYAPNSIAVEPQIFIIKEMPEVDILKILHNPNNRVFLLSATRGFQDIYAGNFTTNFFNEINRILPGKIRMFDRRNQANDDMDNFIIERAKNRKIKVSNISFNNSSQSSDMVSEEIFNVIDVATDNLVKIDDTISIKNSYPLFKQNVFNSSLNWVSELKKIDEFQKSNVYIRDEFLGILNALAHTVENNKSAMIMALSNKFYNFFIKDKKNAQKIFGKFISKGPVKSENKIIEIQISVEKTLKLICYDSELGKKLALEDEFIIEPNKITVLLSSFKSAGTGLNFTLEDNVKKVSKDFDSIYFANSVFYTDIKGDEKNNVFNQILILKSFSHKGNKTLKDLDDGFISSEAYKTLELEHYMEQVKNIMQAIGRIERRDNSIETIIYFVNGVKKDLFNEIMSLFNHVFQKHKNNYKETILANFSMLNKAVLKTAINYTAKNSLNNSDRNSLETQSGSDFKKYNDFFSNPAQFPHMLKEFRACNPAYQWVDEFNKIFREYVSPAYDLAGELTKFIKSNEKLLRETNFHQPILGLIKSAKIDLNKHSYLKDKKITVNYNNHCYSDMTHSRYLISDSYFFDYSQDNYLDVDRKSFLYECIKKYSNNCRNTYSILPNLYLYHLIKGNLGEKIMEDYLIFKKLKFNDFKNLFGQDVYQKTYELFDFYVVKNKTIYCIDIKNWKMYSDNAAQKTLRRLPDKVSILESISEFKEFSLEYIYLNMFEAANHDYSNAMNLLMGGVKNARFINFIEPEVVQKPMRNKKDVIKEYEREVGSLKISTEWSEII